MLGWNSPIADFLSAFNVVRSALIEAPLVSFEFRRSRLQRWEMVSNSAGYSYNVKISSNLEHALVCIICPRSGFRSAKVGQMSSHTSGDADGRHVRLLNPPWSTARPPVWFNIVAYIVGANSV